jgi:nucleoside-diphosphate-sugar epimerase
MDNTLLNSTTLVTGGTGLLGGEVILALATAGHHVRVLVRADNDDRARERLFERLKKSAAYTSTIDRLIDAVAGDTEREMFGRTAARLAGITAIVHCAANTGFNEAESTRIWNTNVGGARNLVAVAKAAAPSARIVFVSTAAVVTEPLNTVLCETAAFAGYTNTYTKSKREAEGILRGSGLDAVVVRPSIVLSCGVRDRAMARSILWAVPIMKELGVIPVNPDAHIDLVPVDFVADAIAGLACTPSLSHRTFHISAGESANTFAELQAAVVRKLPEFDAVKPRGPDMKITDRRMARLLRPIETYLPFINGNLRYDNSRLKQQIGCGDPPSSCSYVPELIELISLDEALVEMYKP